MWLHTTSKWYLGQYRWIHGTASAMYIWPVWYLGTTPKRGFDEIFINILSKCPPCLWVASFTVGWNPLCSCLEDWVRKDISILKSPTINVGSQCGTCDIIISMSFRKLAVVLVFLGLTLWYNITQSRKEGSCLGERSRLVISVFTSTSKCLITCK